MQPVLTWLSWSILVARISNNRLNDLEAILLGLRTNSIALDKLKVRSYPREPVMSPSQGLISLSYWGAIILPKMLSRVGAKYIKSSD